MGEFFSLKLLNYKRDKMNLHWPAFMIDPVNLWNVPDDCQSLPKAYCEQCKYNFHGIDNNHCYMFRTKPGDRCGQFSERLTKGKYNDRDV